MSPQPARLFAALALALALAACQKPSGGDDATPSLTLGDSTRGEITSSSGLNYNDGSRHQGYRISLKKGQAVALELGGALAGQLAIFDGQTLLASASSRGYENDNGGSGNVSLAFRAPRDGSYLVAVNSAGADAFGPFKLDASAVVPYDGKPLLAGSTAIDWLIGDKQQYTLKVDKAGIYTIDMESSALDSYLNLSGGALDLDDDDSGNRLDARIRTYLEPGEYTLSASSVNGNTGAFKLSVAMTAVDHAMVVRDGSALTIGQPAQGMIDGQGRRSFVLVLDSPRQIRFDALSDNFDSVLQISGPGVDAEDDDGGSGTNARLSLTLGAGRYTVVVSSLGGQQGMFTLETTDLGRGAGVDSNRKSETAAEDAATASGH